jgi:hypothetical protein
LKRVRLDVECLGMIPEPEIEKKTWNLLSTHQEIEEIVFH